jgi:circadian clock protein KaiB
MNQPHSSLYNEMAIMEVPESQFSLTLYISGASPNSARAIANLKNICEKYISGKYELEIIDVYQQPSKAKSDHLIALPMLVKQFPLPVKKLFGDLSDTPKVLGALGLNK